MMMIQQQQQHHLDSLPTEMLFILLSYFSGDAINALLPYSPRIQEIQGTVPFRSTWLKNYGHIKWNLIMTDQKERARLVHLAWTLDRQWAISIYDGMTLYGRIGVFESLLNDVSLWSLAKHLASLEKSQDDCLSNPSNGIFYRHYQWRLANHNCIL